MPDVQTVPPKLTRSAALDQLAAFFEDQRDGECAVELAEALAHVAKEVRAHNKSGSVSLTIRLTPIGKVDALFGCCGAFALMSSATSSAASSARSTRRSARSRASHARRCSTPRRAPSASTTRSSSGSA